MNACISRTALFSGRATVLQHNQCDFNNHDHSVVFYGCKVSLCSHAMAVVQMLLSDLHYKFARKKYDKNLLCALICEGSVLSVLLVFKGWCAWSHHNQ